MARDTRNRFMLFSAALALCLALGVALFGPAAVSAAPAGDTITYVVRPGDRLVDIAARYGVTMSSIVRANGLNSPDMIYPGQKLVIAVSGGGSATSTPEPAPGQGTIHIVQLGDTLDKIARRYGVSASAIVRANGITNADLIWVGQKLAIPGSAPAAAATPTSIPEPAATPTPTPEPVATPVEEVATPDVAVTPLVTPAPAPTATPVPTAEPIIHVVQAGETLSSIAQRYGTSVGALVAANGLGSADLIRVGMRLLIVQGTGDEPVYSGQATRFEVSISQQRCWLYRGETVIAKWVCSTGRSGAGTRTGTFYIQSKLPKAYGSTWDIWMPYWLGIYWAGSSENGIHGLPWNAKTGVQVWTGYVGTPITYGCVMLDNVNAKMLYDMAYIGMPVVIRW